MAERRDVVGGDLDDGNGAEDADKGPEDEHNVADFLGHLAAVPQEARDGCWEMLPWWRWEPRINVSIDVYVPSLRMPPRHGGWLNGVRDGPQSQSVVVPPPLPPGTLADHLPVV